MFEKHIENICPKVSRKLNTLARVKNYMELPKIQTLINAIFKINSTVVRSLSNKVSRFHDR